MSKVDESQNALNKSKCVKLNVSKEDSIVKAYVPNSKNETLVLSGNLCRVEIKNGEVVVVPKAKKPKKAKKYKSAISEDNIVYSIDKVKLKAMHYLNNVSITDSCKDSNGKLCKFTVDYLGVNHIISMLQEVPYLAFFRSKYKEQDSFDLFGWDRQEEVNVFDTILNYYSITHSHKTGVSYYRDNYFIKDLNKEGQECSFWLGVGHNSSKLEVSGEYTKIDVTIEYNPNKCEGSLALEFILDNIFRRNKYVEVKKFDLAVDLFNVNILDIGLFNNGKRGYRLIDNSSDDRTHYIGKRGSNGAIKIYNKAREQDVKRKALERETNKALKEQGKEEISLGDDLNNKFSWTRYEVTFIPPSNHTIETIADGLYSVDTSLFADIVYINNFALNDEGLQGVDRFLLEVCLKYPDQLLSLKKSSRSKYKKIEQLLRQSCSISFDYTCINSIIADYFKTIVYY